jgi:hypothetical protein
MNNHVNSIIPRDIFEYFEHLFNMRSDESKKISLADFKDIVYENQQIDKEVVLMYVAQIKRDFKKSGDQNRKMSNSLFNYPDKNEFAEYLNYIFYENNKNLNEKDPELSII